MPAPRTSQIVTTALDGTGARYLGSIGHVSGLVYSFACPGGCDQLSATLTVPASYKTQAMEAGRLVQVIRGAGSVWNGQMLEPEPTPGGWALTAVGSGNFGTNFGAMYTTWNNNPDEAVNEAIAGGLPWTNAGIGSPAGMWLGQRVDPGAQTITALLNLVTTRGGLVWEVSRRNALSVVPLPAAVDRLLISSTPVARTLGGYYNTIPVRYQTPNPLAQLLIKTPTVFRTTVVTNQASVDAHGPLWAPLLDLSSALVGSGANPEGLLVERSAQAVGNFVLQRYQGASFAGPFAVSPSQLLTTGGVPVDLGSQKAGMVCQLILTDYGYGAELSASPVTFLVGGYSYDDDAQVATVTPFQNLRSDIGSLLAVAAGQRGRGVGDWQRGGR